MNEPMHRMRWRLLQGGLVGCVTLACIAASWLWLAPVRPPAFDHAPGSRPSTPSAAPTPPAPLASLATAARDALFRIDGAGGAAAATAPESPAEAVAIARWRVAGVALGEPPQAILEEVSTHATRLVTRGQRLDGWTVDAIDGHRVVLRRQGVTTDLSF